MQNPRHKLDDKCLCLSYVFRSVLACAKSAHVFQKRYSLCRSLSLTNNSSSDSKAFLRFIAFSGSPTAVATPSIACTTESHCGHTFLNRAHKRQSLTSKFNGKCMLKSLDNTLPIRTWYTETLHVKKMADLYGKYITLLTFLLN